MTPDWAPALAFFGLHVAGDWHAKRGVWVVYPEAHFTCRWGCELFAVGAAEVAYLTDNLTAHHARICPGPPA
ncbi:MAG: hypothetical protein HOZ81_27990 [Streptomyces sp.]|nr:hypothetical protein [Streptomyces sp.]